MNCFRVRAAGVLLSCVANIHAAEPPRSYALAALAPGNRLVVFRSDSPGAVGEVALSGVTDPVIGIDARPADGKLYGITSTDQLVLIDTTTGVTRAVSRLRSPFRGGEATGFDFNPQSDRLRLVGPAGENLRIQVTVGAVALDGVLSYATDDQGAAKRPRIAAVAYTNSFANAPSTVMFDIDAQLDTLVRQDPPNDGVLRTVGPLGIDCADAAGFDIASPRQGIDDGFLVCGSLLYRVDLLTGKTRPVGQVAGSASRFLSLAVLLETAR